MARRLAALVASLLVFALAVTSTTFVYLTLTSSMYTYRKVPSVGMR